MEIKIPFNVSTELRLLKATDKKEMLMELKGKLPFHLDVLEEAKRTLASTKLRNTCLPERVQNKTSKVNRINESIEFLEKLLLQEQNNELFKNSF